MEDCKELGLVLAFGFMVAFGWGFVFVFRLAFWWCSWSHLGWLSWIWSSWSQSEAWWLSYQHGPGGACGAARRRVKGSVP